MERIGIYGGTFNPPHVGHIAAAKFGAQALKLTKMLVIPSCVSPHKTLPRDSATPQQRLKMLQIALSDAPDVEVSDLELQRGDVSYTYETVEQIASLYPRAERILFMGTDMFLSFDRWRHPEKILKQASLAVFYRGDRDEKEKIQNKKADFEKQGAKIYLVENPVLEISSTDLRRLLVFGCTRSFLPGGVAEYIKDQGLYRTDESFRGLSLSRLQEEVTALLRPERVAHVLGCCETAGKMALRYGADVTDAKRGALLHDITKALDGPLQLTLCREYGITLDEFSYQNPKTLHALTGSLVAERIFGENTAVVSAIACHTMGKPAMNTLEKILYIADTIEPTRNFPGVDDLREMAWKDLDEALETVLRRTVEMLQEQGRQVSLESLQALEYLKNNAGKKE